MFVAQIKDGPETASRSPRRGNRRSWLDLKTIGRIIFVSSCSILFTLFTNVIHVGAIITTGPIVFQPAILMHNVFKIRKRQSISLVQSYAVLRIENRVLRLAVPANGGNVTIVFYFSLS